MTISRKLNSIIFLLLFQILFCQNKVSKEYLLNPKKEDILCKNEIAKATKDLKKFDGFYFREICLGCPREIFDKEINVATKLKNFKIIDNFKSCLEMTSENQTFGCYNAFLKLKMEEKFGTNSNQIIDKLADSILISKIKTKNISLDYSDLKDNEKPTLKNWKENPYNVYLPVLKSECNLKKDNINHSFIDIEFIIEKNGKISNLNVINWHSGFKENKKYKHKLMKLAKEKILAEFNDWNPGNYMNNIIRVKNNFRVSFE